MNRTLLSAVAGLALLAPFTMSNAQDYRGQDRQQEQSQRDRDRDRDAQARRDDGREQRDQRQNWRDNRNGAHWDETRHNGYYYNNRWYFGPPPANRYGRAGFALGHQPWQRGQRLGYFNNRFQEVNFRQHGLQTPSRGYRWVRDDRGDFLLVFTRTGQIARVVVNQNQYANRDRRQAWRDDRRDARWDESRHNGFYRNNTWTYGPPPAGYNARDVTYGYQPWAAGQRLGYYNNRYAEVNYRTQNLSAPPRGHHWVRNNDGDFLLVAIATGIIAQAIIQNNR